MSPYQRLSNGLAHFRQVVLEEIDEALTFVDVMKRQQNSLTYDNENNVFYVTAVGTAEEVIPVMYKQIEQLERIQKQRNSS